MAGTRMGLILGAILLPAAAWASDPNPDVETVLQEIAARRAEMAKAEARSAQVRWISEENECGQCGGEVIRILATSCSGEGVKIQLGEGVSIQLEEGDDD